MRLAWEPHQHAAVLGVAGLFVTQKRVTAVPTARNGRVQLAGGNRGQYERAARASSMADFDLAMTDLLGLPQPERPPPNVSKSDRK